MKLYLIALIPAATTGLALHPKLAKGCATVATCAALLQPLAAPAAESTSVQVDVNTPFLLDLVKSSEARTATFDRFSFLAEATKSAIGPAVSVRPPTDIKGFTKNALSGGASVEVNGQKVGVQVVGSSKGSLTVELTNPLIPAIPFAGLPTTPAVINGAANAAADAAPGVVDTVESILAIKMEKPQPFWNRPISETNFRLDVDAGSLSFHRAFTPVDVVGGGSLFLGGVYAASYAFYVSENERVAAEAAEKKKTMAAKREAAAKKKKEAEVVKAAATAKKSEEAKKVSDLVDKIQMEELPEKVMEAMNTSLKNPVGEEESDSSESPKKRNRIQKILGM